MKKLNKIAIAIYLFTFLLEISVTISFTGMSIFEGEILNVENIISVIFLLIFPFITLFPFYGFVLFTNFGKKYGNRSKLSKIDFAKEKDYYRDIVRHYSMMELSYIDDYKTGMKKDIVAALLSLQLKKRIVIHDQGIEVIDKTVTDLKRSEVFLLNHIKGKRLCVSMVELKSQVIQESLEDNVIRKEEFMDYAFKAGSIALFTIMIYVLSL